MSNSRFSPAEVKRRNLRMYGPDGPTNRWTPVSAETTPFVETADNGITAASMQSGDY